jgi:large subunit ribosomal protein L17
MRHRRVVRRFGTDSEHHRAILRNLAISLLLHEKIQTTLPKAKELARYVERLITAARSTLQGVDEARKTAVYRRIWRFLHHKAAMKRLVRDILPRFADRAGGYTRIVKTGKFRVGDGAELAIICFIGSEEVRISERQKRLEKKAKRVRR